MTLIVLYITTWIPILMVIEVPSWFAFGRRSTLEAAPPRMTSQELQQAVVLILLSSAVTDRLFCTPVTLADVDTPVALTELVTPVALTESEQPTLRWLVSLLTRLVEVERPTTLFELVVPYVDVLV